MRKLVIFIILGVIGYIAYNKIQSLLNRGEGISFRMVQNAGEYGETPRQGEARYYTFTMTKPWLIRFNVNPEEAAAAEQSLMSLTRTPLSAFGLTRQEPNLQLRVWHIIYKKAYREAKPVVKRLAGIFKQIRKDHRLSEIQLAQVVLRFIQFIPYRRPGGRFDYYTPARTLADNGLGGNAAPPRGYTKGWNGAGDCDTKTVLQIALLEELGIKALMFHSFRYSHAMIGINVNGLEGAYKTVNGIRYYFSETTYPNWRLGQLPPQYSDLDFWVPLVIAREEPANYDAGESSRQGNEESQRNDEQQGDKFRERPESSDGNK